jgi:hypothetical protein
MNSYHHSDQWSGAAWLTSGAKSAVVFIGTKGTGDCWYGCPDGTVWPEEPPYPPDCPERGWWSSGFEGQMIFYDADDFAAVVGGTMDTWEPQPYAVLPIDEYLYHITSGQQKEHVGAASFDRQSGLLYVFEPLVDDDKSIVHVWKVRPDTTEEAPRIRLSADSLSWDFAWVGHPSARALTIFNDGEGVLNVSGIASDDARFVPSSTLVSVAPLSSQTLDVIFTPTYEVPCEAILTVTCNDPSRPEIHVALRGTGILVCYGGDSGDVNGDGVTNVIDVIGAVNHILGTSVLDDDGMCRSDCDVNGIINVLDVLGIVNHILGLGVCGE